MKLFRADLHIHTVLSPCGSLEMSPERIVAAALDKKMDIIAITDHNSTRQWRAVREVGLEKGLMVIGGAEINTREEVHCLALFENDDALALFQDYIDLWLPAVKNIPEKFGHQVWVDRHEHILGEEERLLWTGLNQSIEQVAEKVHELEGLFIPAHVDRQAFGLYSQLGFFPLGLQVDALEVTHRVTAEFIESKGIGDHFRLITSSDAHDPYRIGESFTWFRMQAPTFNEMRLALQGVDGREVWPGGELFQKREKR